MAQKCKKGFKKVGSTCVSNKTYKKFGKFADEVTILKLALIGAVTSVGGWAIFTGIVGLFHIDKFPNWVMLLFGLVVVVLVYKFGLTKVK